ncbi:MAG: outer membrane lipoprotein-sorting protein [Armatimonadota bacterium]
MSADIPGNDLKIRASQATQGFKDLKLTCKVTYANIKELKKISKDFSQRYEFKTSTLMYKSPDKLKMEGKLGLVKMKIVINGDRKAFVIPSVGYSKKENLKDKPARRQSDFDIGIFSDSLWDYYNINKIENEKGSNGPVYKITFHRDNSKGKRLVCWVDAEALKLHKLETYDKNGDMQVRYTYTRHIKAGSCIWLPMKIDIYNNNESHAATVEYEDVAVNTGISDSEFKI